MSAHHSVSPASNLQESDSSFFPILAVYPSISVVWKPGAVDSFMGSFVSSGWAAVVNRRKTAHKRVQQLVCGLRIGGTSEEGKKKARTSPMARSWAQNGYRRRKKDVRHKAESPVLPSLHSCSWCAPRWLPCVCGRRSKSWWQKPKSK